MSEAGPMKDLTPAPRSHPGAESKGESNPVREFESLWRTDEPPDVREFLERNPSLTPQQVVELLTVDQWQRWQKGEHVRAETYLQMIPNLTQSPQVAFDLVYGEFLLLEESEEEPSLEEFIERFPQFADLLRRQAQFHRAIEADSVSTAPRLAGPPPPPPQTSADQAGKPKGSAEWPIVPGYTILAKLGEGGMGQVFKAKQERLDRLVALKIIRPECLSHDPHALKRVQQEARAAAKLSHPNIIGVYDFDRVGNTYFIAMEYVDGVDLHQLVRDCGPLPVPLCCHFIHQAALGLHHAHLQGMVHRDIKPSNLLVALPSVDVGMSGFRTLPLKVHRQLIRPGDSAVGSALSSKAPLDHLQEGVVKILDMGMALLTHRPGDADSPRWTHQGTFMGTPDFIAPEQAMDAHDVDIRADLYSLGCTFYFLLTGKPPFGDFSLMKKLMMHQIAKPQPLRELQAGVPSEVERIVNRLLAKRPDGRFQTPFELAEALVTFSLQDVSTAKPRPASSPSLPVNLSPALPVSDRDTGEDKQLGKKADQESPEDLQKKWTGRDEAAAGTKTAKVVALFKGHASWVMAVAFSPDRHTLASGAVHGAVRLWDLSGAKPCERAVLATEPAEVHSLAFDPENRLLAIGSGSLSGRIWLWDLSGLTPKKKITLPGHQSPVEALTFSPDGRWLASGGCDKSIRLWEFLGAEPKELAVFKGHTGNVKALAFSPDGKTLASASLDGTVGFWRRGSIWSKDLLAALQGDWGPVHTIAYSADGKTLAFGSLDQTVRIFDLSGDQCRPRATLKGHVGVVRQIQFNPDGKTLASACDGGRVICWQLASGSPVQEWQLPKAKVSSVAITFDGRYLASGTSDGLVKIFRIYERNE